MYKLNDVKKEQQSLFSKEDNWTEYQKKIVRNGWIGYFHDKVFPSIDEVPFAVIYFFILAELF